MLDYITKIQNEDITFLEQLEYELEEAVAVENYERAAELRDQLKIIKNIKM